MKNPYPINASTRERFERALAAEPSLRTATRTIDVLCALVRPQDELCYACAWELIIKPQVTPYVGWVRGKVGQQADDLPVNWKSGDSLPIVAIDIRELFAFEEAHPPAAPESATEAWLRTSEAYDAVCSVLLSRLWDADPGNGCGIRRGSEHPHAEL